jgi:uncharacterized membrane protein
MSIWSCRLMKENELSRPGKFLVSLLLLMLVVGAGISAVYNVMHGTVHQPRAFAIVLLGFVCLAIAKISVIRHARLVSFGTRVMTEDQANFYRVGYYLMGLGFIFTFA